MDHFSKSNLNRKYKRFFFTEDNTDIKKTLNKYFHHMEGKNK